MKKNINLELLRILAALLVLSVHIGCATNIDMAIGQTGVTLFFLISGYLAFASIDKNPSILLYYKKRIVKIIPAYYSCLILLYGYDLTKHILKYGMNGIFTGQCGIKFVRYFLFIQCLIPSDNFEMWNNHSALWTMSAFAVFYLLAPIFYKIMNKRNNAIIVMLFSVLTNNCIVIYIKNLLSNVPDISYPELYAIHNPFSVLHVFLIGGFVYVFVRDRKQYLACLILLLLGVITKFQTFQCDIIYALVMMSAVSFDESRINSKLYNAILLFGNITFVLYLTHPILLDAYNLLHICIFNKYISAAMLYFVCILFAYIFNILIVNNISNLLKEKMFD